MAHPEETEQNHTAIIADSIRELAAQVQRIPDERLMLASIQKLGNLAGALIEFQNLALTTADTELTASNEITVLAADVERVPAIVIDIATPRHQPAKPTQAALAVSAMPNTSATPIPILDRVKKDESDTVNGSVAAPDVPSRPRPVVPPVNTSVPRAREVGAFTETSLTPRDQAFLAGLKDNAGVPMSAVDICKKVGLGGRGADTQAFLAFRRKLETMPEYDGRLQTSGSTVNRRWWFTAVEPEGTVGMPATETEVPDASDRLSGGSATAIGVAGSAAVEGTTAPAARAAERVVVATPTRHIPAGNVTQEPYPANHIRQENADTELESSVPLSMAEKVAAEFKIPENMRPITDWGLGIGYSENVLCIAKQPQKIGGIVRATLAILAEFPAGITKERLLSKLNERARRNEKSPQTIGAFHVEKAVGMLGGIFNRYGLSKKMTYPVTILPGGDRIHLIKLEGCLPVPVSEVDDPAEV